MTCFVKVVKAIRTIICLLAGMLSAGVYALDSQTMADLRQDYLYYQLWAMSRDYWFGTTLKQDKVKALAWEIVYLQQLPEKYPGKDRLIAAYTEQMTAQQVAQAKALSLQLQQVYQFQPAPDEARMFSAYAQREDSKSWMKIAGSAEYPEAIKQWLQQQISALKAQKQAYTIVYGQVWVQGVEPPQLVSSEVEINGAGYFIGFAKTPTLHFNLTGYNPMTVKLSKDLAVQKVSTIVLSPAAQRQNTGVVGKVVPWEGVSQGNLLLRRKPDQPIDGNQFWQHHAIPLTVTRAGDFYAVGLSPGHYQLFINTPALSTYKEFSLRAGEIRGLSLIDLRQKKA